MYCHDDDDINSSGDYREPRTDAPLQRTDDSAEK